MTSDSAADTAYDFDLFLVAPPGLEGVLCAEAREHGFRKAKPVPGGVTCSGDWAEAWRANLVLRGASRVLVRIAAFKVQHLAQLQKKAQALPWTDFLRPGVPIRVDASCRKSKLYHSGAVAERIGKAAAEVASTELSDDAPIRILARLDNDLCTISLDTSGEPLHKRGHKPRVNKAPMRETLAALFLRQCGYKGQEPVIDPMCGSGTFVIEAAEQAAGLAPGRSRDFAFQLMAGFDPDAWTALRNAVKPGTPPVRFYGYDRDAGAVEMSRANADSAGVTAWTDFTQQPISDLTPPEGSQPGLVIVNPPYGTRIGEAKKLHPLYHTLGKVLTDRFSGWRVGLITTQPSLAKATALPFTRDGGPIDHGGLKVTLSVTGPLP